jgi:hypothetical protein
MLSENKRHMHVFLSFVEEDLPRVRPLAAALAASENVSTDYSLTTERFDAPESEYIRASLWNRIKRSTATLCLLGDATLKDPWVGWSLRAAYQLRRCLVAASFRTAEEPEDQSGEAQRLLLDLGVLVVPAQPEEILRALSHAEQVSAAHRDGPSLARLLRGLRTPLSTS